VFPSSSTIIMEAALSLHRLRHVLRPMFRTPFIKPLFATVLPTFLTSPRRHDWSIIPSLQSLLEELFPPFLLAVPKKKVSHSRKAMRASGKGLKDKQNIVNCPGCGTPKLAHHLCKNCYTFLSRMWKGNKKSIPDLS